MDSSGGLPAFMSSERMRATRGGDATVHAAPFSQPRASRASSLILSKSLRDDLLPETPHILTARDIAEHQRQIERDDSGEV